MMESGAGKAKTAPGVTKAEEGLVRRAAAGLIPMSTLSRNLQGEAEKLMKKRGFEKQNTAAEAAGAQNAADDDARILEREEDRRAGRTNRAVAEDADAPGVEEQDE